MSEEVHAMDKPKKLEVQTDGDLSEIKKDPVWKTWLEKQDGPEHQAQPEEDHEPTPIEEAEQEAEEKTEQVVVGGGLNNALHLIGLSYKSWLEKGLGILGEGKLNRRTGKPMKLKPRKITLDEFEHEKPGDKKPSYYQAVMEEEGRKREKKKKYTPKHPMTRVHTGESELRQEQRKTKPYKFCPTCGDKIPIETRRRLEDKEKKKADKIEELESDYYMDAGGNPQRKEKADYFVEEIKANVIFYDKIFPLIGMVAGQVARGLGQAGKKVGGGLLQDIGEVSQGMMEDEEEQ